ncbi:MAG: DUF2177 family protein [Acidobacteria bacterium]|nr:DUF2177 family protein [Acidobacteriota bacterium]
MAAAPPKLVGAEFFCSIFVARKIRYGVRPLRLKALLRQPVGAGTLFGFFSYATWALTAFPILKDIPRCVADADILWSAGAAINC